MTHTRTHAQAKDRSYAVRNQIAEALGKDQGRDFHCAVSVTLDDHRSVTLLSTSNAGFNGITGWFEAKHLDGSSSRFTTSLGHVAAFSVKGTTVAS